MNSSFIWGFAFGVGAVWGYHRFVKPMPSKAG